MLTILPTISTNSGQLLHFPKTRRNILERELTPEKPICRNRVTIMYLHTENLVVLEFIGRTGWEFVLLAFRFAVAQVLFNYPAVIQLTGVDVVDGDTRLRKFFEEVNAACSSMNFAGHRMVTGHRPGDVFVEAFLFHGIPLALCEVTVVLEDNILIRHLEFSLCHM